MEMLKDQWLFEGEDDVDEDEEETEETEEKEETEEEIAA